MIIDRLSLKDFEKIKPLLNDYKSSIKEDQLTAEQFRELKNAIKNEKITFYNAVIKDEIVAMCSISTAFSTYNCQALGIFEDFYIKPSYRGKGLAAKLTDFVFGDMKKRNIETVWVGCADVDVNMYKHLGFNLVLGNLLAWCSS